MSLTIAYITARRGSKIDWFFDSLARQVSDEDQVKVIVVDHFAKERLHLFNSFQHVEGKPNVWNGPHRLTKEDWWAVASMRNTALCLCDTTHISYVDDLSVLMPGWLNAVKVSVAGDYIGCGAYKKVKKLRVENGEAVSYEEFPSGVDHRLAIAKEDVAPCTPGWLFGCSCVFPVEALLTVGGFPEFCDSLGGEDYCLGIALRNAGFHLKYCRKMLTLESEELHFVEPPMKKTDKGISPNDKSHAALNIAKGTKYFDNYYEGGIRKMREEVLSGKPFPIVQIPTCDWFDSQPLSEM